MRAHRWGRSLVGAPAWLLGVDARSRRRVAGAAVLTPAIRLSSTC